MNPSVSHLDAFFANMRIGRSELYVIQVCAISQGRLHVSEFLISSEQM
jgi:hypothetical protein